MQWKWKRSIALLCAAIYISTASAGAATEIQQVAETSVEQVAVAQTDDWDQVSEEIAAPAENTLPESAAEMTEESSTGLTDMLASDMRVAALKVVPSAHKVQVNGESVNPQVYNIDGNNYFKLRDVAYLLNGTTSSFDVTWDSAKNAVNLLSGKSYTAVGDEMTVASSSSLRVQQSTAKVLLDGNSVSIKGYNINGNNYYKIADVSVVMGFTAAFESTTQTVKITTPASSDPEQGEPETPEQPFVTGIYKVKVETTLSIRSGPGTTYSIVGSLKNGDQVVVDSLSNGWAHIMNTQSYCSADYLVRIGDYDDNNEPDTPDEPSEPEPEFTTGVYRVKVDSSLSVRCGAGTQYPIIGRLQNGDEIVIDDITDGWAHIMDTSEASGRYCSADYLTRVRDYDVSEGEPDDVVDPPRTSHLDGKMTVIIDAGHGGSDVGAHNADASLDEKHVNLAVAQYLQSYLEQAGVKVIMIRSTLEEGSSLSLRGTVMQQYASSADLFFSIHHNAANTTARGAEVLAQIADRNGGPTKILGEALLEEYSKLGVPIRSIVFREGSNGDYYYTNRVAASLFIPAITSEFCFIDNVEDQKFIDSEEDLQAQARAQYNAIMYYFSQVDY